MNMFFKIPRGIHFMVVFMIALMMGCSDSISENDANLAATDQFSTSQKSKFTHLMNVESRILGDESDDDDDDDDSEDDGQAGGGTAYQTKLIMGLDNAVITADRLLKRYSLLTGYRLLKRYDGTGEVVYGIVGEFSDLEHDDIESDDDFELSISEIIDELEFDEDVQWIEPDIQLQEPVSNASFEVVEGQVTPWNIGVVGQTSADLSGVDVYLLDSGLYSNDLNVVEEMDFVGEQVSPNGRSHGYHVAGVLGARDNGKGVVGVAPGARIHSFRVLNNVGETSTSIVVQALDEVISRKNAYPAQPMVVNLSLGANTGSTAYTALDHAVEAAIAAGVVVVVSAGNEGVDVATVTPAHVTGAITVGAHNNNDTYSSFSNYGALVDILAPGNGILSSVGVQGSGAIQLSSSSGTSMAAPHVAGAAVAYLQANPTATPAEVRDALVGSASASVGSVPPNTTNRTVKVQSY